MAQGAINARRRDFKTLVFNPIYLQRKLQLAGDFFTVFHGDKLINRGLGRIDGRLHPWQVDGDAQQATRRPFDLHQVVTETGHNLFNDLL